VFGTPVEVGIPDEPVGPLDVGMPLEVGTLLGGSTVPVEPVLPVEVGVPVAPVAPLGVGVPVAPVAPLGVGVPPVSTEPVGPLEEGVLPLGFPVATPSAWLSRLSASELAQPMRAAAVRHTLAVPNDLRR
jgi:hypothetical protein